MKKPTDKIPQNAYIINEDVEQINKKQKGCFSNICKNAESKRTSAVSTREDTSGILYNNNIDDDIDGIVYKYTKSSCSCNVEDI